MSVQTIARRLTPPAIAARKGGEPIVCLTAYSARFAELLDPCCDLLLVGDSLGMVIYGLPSTLDVTMDMMIAHGKAVVGGSSTALVAVDMPFGSYEESPQTAFRNAARIMAETHCAAVKLEGGQAMAQTIAFLTARGIPVVAHVGLQPQSVNVLGGYGARGRDMDEATRILADAHAVADAGAFAVVLEGITQSLAERITAELPIVTIGIGASAACDGQILVTEDMLGLFDRVPKFVKRFGAMSNVIEQAAEHYAADVKARRFPGADHVYGDAPKATKDSA